MCFVQVRAIAAGVVSGGVLLVLGTQGIANAAPLTHAASPATSKNCVQVAAATSSPGTPTQTPTAPASQASNPGQSSAPAQAPSSSSASNTPASQATNSSSSSTTSAPASPADSQIPAPPPSRPRPPQSRPQQRPPQRPLPRQRSARSSRRRRKLIPEPVIQRHFIQPGPHPRAVHQRHPAASSIQRGQAGTFTLEVSSQNWTLSDNVTVELQTQPTSITPAFTTQDGTFCKPSATTPVACTMPVPTKQAQAIQVQIPVAATAKSVTQVALKAIALPATAKLAGPLSASETAQVTAAPTTKKQTSPAATSTAPAKHNTDPLGPVSAGSFDVGQLPELNGAASSVIGSATRRACSPRSAPPRRQARHPARTAARRQTPIRPRSSPCSRSACRWSPRRSSG